MKTFTALTKRTYLNRSFYFVKHDNWYVSIEDKYLTNGMLNSTLNATQLHPEKTLERCIRDTMTSVYVDHYMDDLHMEFEDAMNKMFKEVWYNIEN